MDLLQLRPALLDLKSQKTSNAVNVQNLQVINMIYENINKYQIHLSHTNRSTSLIIDTWALKEIGWGARRDMSPTIILIVVLQC